MQDAELILVGVHGAGKTTLGQVLSSSLGVPFDPELGRLMRLEALERDPLCDAQADQPWFDELLWQRELERDAKAQGLRGLPVRRVVETWHIGNAAYAAARHGQEAAWHERLRRVLASSPVPIIVQPLCLGPEAFHARFGEPGINEAAVRQFLLKVARDIQALIEPLPIYKLEPIWTDHHDPISCAQLILEGLRALPTLVHTPQGA